MENTLTAKNLGKTFNAGTRAEVKAVNGVTLSVKPGEIVMIMGPSGSGKTTLLTMIGGLLKPSEGEISLAGSQIAGLGQGALTQLRRERIGFIFQSFNLLENLSAIENVMIGAFHQAGRRQKAEKLLVKLGLSKRMRAFPRDLSGGERQRVAISRALINDPDLILADEPTANLDSKIGHQVMQLLCAVGCEEEKSIIIVSHDERIKDVAHRVIYIEDGQLTREERGRHNQICQMKNHKQGAK